MVEGSVDLEFTSLGKWSSMRNLARTDFPQPGSADTSVGISHHVTCHVTDHRTHIAAAVAPSFLESTPLQPTGYDPYCVLPTLLWVVCSYLYYLCNCRQLCTAVYVIFTH